MKTVWILGDQLNPGISSLAELTPDNCIVLFIESLHAARRRPYHKQKLVFIWSAMRHFAADLRALGYVVDYQAWQPNADAGLAEHIHRYKPSVIRLMDTAEHGRAQRLARLVEEHGAVAEVTPNNQFLSDREWFLGWAGDRQTLRMESFYREMRRRTDLLMTGGAPVGGDWNYDQHNRETPPPNHNFPSIPHYPPDRTTREVIAFVEEQFPDHFGRLEGFGWPVSRNEAQAFLADFLAERLDLFGPYEDAMALGERALYHSLLSPLFNVGLLEPLTACRQAIERYRAGQARLNSVEGFVRQLIGWREFVYQVYHLAMPGYTGRNALAADLPLPSFYWTADTDMRCVADAVETLQTHGLNHHIQRLMVTGNFALLAGINPSAVNEWYWFAYLDAYEWVVTPNVIGMALYADGGLIATKPYAASANYINKMGDACGRCAYDRRQVAGEKACPFNALYWDFVARNLDQLSANPRMNLVTAQARKKKDLGQIRAHAARIRARLRSGDRV
jgi:deoxyribodipyrimidine photolyase-related protein